MKNNKLLSKFKNLDSEKKTNYFYVTVFLIIVVLALVFKLTDKDKTVNNPGEDNNIEVVNTAKEKDYKEFLKSLNDNYNLSLKISAYFDNEYINVVKIGNSVVIESENKEYNKRYVKTNNKLYELAEDDSYIEVNKYTKNDQTFIPVSNLIKLLDRSYLYNGEYIISSSEYIKLYNEINNSNIKTVENKNITISFSSISDSKIKIVMDLTNLYNVLGYDYKSVIHEEIIETISAADLLEFGS